MPADPAVLTVEQVKRELMRLRKSRALAHPSAVLRLSGPLRHHLTADRAVPPGTAGEVTALMAGLRGAIDGLGAHERVYAEVDFNLAAAHSFPTLTERQESLAHARKCTAKTVRRHGDRVLNTLALLVVTRQPEPVEAQASELNHNADRTPVLPATWEEDVRRFWRLGAGRRVDIVCSEIPPEERPAFASPEDRNYLRYAKFADLDSLVYLRGRLTQAFPDVAIRDFSPSEYFDTDSDTLVVIGGPPWNAKYREFLPELPFFFEPHAIGEDDPLVIPQLDRLSMGPKWTQRAELLEDLAIFTRLSLAQGTTVFLLGGCLTLGVLGAAKCFLHAERGAGNVRYLDELVGADDFVCVTEARRVGGITDTTDLSEQEPLLVLARNASTRSFRVVTDNSDRYLSR